MKGFLTWFKGSTKIKRWMFLILVGVVLVCYGFSNLLINDRMEFFDVIKVIASFIFGFIFVTLGIVYIQKRTLELLIEANETLPETRQKAQVNIQSLIFNKKVYEKGPKIVVIGGGNGLNMVVEGLKNYTSNITAVVMVTDYGNAPSDSRMQLNLLPMDDIKDSIAALSEYKEVMENLLKYKFENSRMKNLVFGDILLSAMEEIYGNVSDSVENTAKILNMVGKVLPVTSDKIDICAELEDGTIVKEKNKIPEVVYDKVSKINRIFINPTNCVVAPGVLEAIKEADAIIIGPGSIYTNVIPSLLVKGVARTIKESKGFKIYISNIMTQPGQTDNYSLSDHIDAIVEHAGEGIIDYCICDTGEIVPEFVRRYNKLGSDIVERNYQDIKNKNIKIIQKNLSRIEGEYIRHDPDMVASTIMELICTDLKFKDQQYNTQYVLLNSKLKEHKKTEKTKKKINDAINKKNRKNQKNSEDNYKTKSKFNKKYSDRIRDIKNSDKIREKNKRLFEETGSLYRIETEIEKKEGNNTPRRQKHKH